MEAGARGRLPTTRVLAHAPLRARRYKPPALTPLPAFVPHITAPPCPCDANPGWCVSLLLPCCRLWCADLRHGGLHPHLRAAGVHEPRQQGGAAHLAAPALCLHGWVRRRRASSLPHPAENRACRGDPQRRLTCSSVGGLAGVVCVVLSGSVAGYCSARLFKFFNGKNWKLNTILTATLFPGRSESPVIHS